MKKVLFATSALVMSAGFAVAEVAVSGDGRMGMIYDGDDVQFSSRARVLFTLTGESDSGLSFGGKFRVDQENYSANPEGRSAAKGSAGAVWISGTYGKLSMGDVVSAAEAAIGDLYEIGYTDGEFAGDIEEISFLTGDGNNKDQGPTILYEYSIDNISFYASVTDGSDTAWPSTTGSAGGYESAYDNTLANKNAYSLAAKYDGGNWNAALSYAKHDKASEIGLAAEGSFDAFTVKGVFMKYDDLFVGNAIDDGGAIITDGNGDNVIGRVRDRADATAELKHTVGLAAAYNMDALTVKGFWRQDKISMIAGGSEKADSFGIGADYDLGGGATLAGGIVDSDLLNDTVADFGIKFKF